MAARIKGALVDEMTNGAARKILENILTAAWKAGYGVGLAAVTGASAHALDDATPASQAQTYAESRLKAFAAAKS